MYQGQIRFCRTGQTNTSAQACCPDAHLYAVHAATCTRQQVQHLLTKGPQSIISLSFHIGVTK